MKLQRFVLPALVSLVLGAISIMLGAQGQAPTPGVVAGGFCTYEPGFLKTSNEAAQRINQYFALGPTLQPLNGAEFFHVGVPSNPPPPYAYTWTRTGTTAIVGKGKRAVQVDLAVASLLQALAAASGPPSAFSESAANPTDMGTAGILGAQALTLKINQGFSEVFVTPATGFSGLSLVDMDGVELDGTALTPAQVLALNGQATLQIREAADVPLGGGALPYGLSFGQLTDLIDLLNGSFGACGQPSGFAQAHLYQPYVTSNAFAGKRPSTVSTFASKPTYNTFSGEVVFVGRGCPAGSVNGSNPEDTYLVDPTGKIALIERGGCRFDYKVAQAQLKGAAAAIVFNNQPAAGCPAAPTPGSNQCESLVGMGGNNPVVLVPPPTFTWSGFGTSITIPAAFVQRSTGLLLRNGPAPVIASIQQ
jgi:PA domain